MRPTARETPRDPRSAKIIGVVDDPDCSSSRRLQVAQATAPRAPWRGETGPPRPAGPEKDLRALRLQNHSSPRGRTGRGPAAPRRTRLRKRRGRRSLQQNSARASVRMDPAEAATCAPAVDCEVRDARIPQQKQNEFRTRSATADLARSCSTTTPQGSARGAGGDARGARRRRQPVLDPRRGAAGAGDHLEARRAVAALAGVEPRAAVSFLRRAPKPPKCDPGRGLRSPLTRLVPCERRTSVRVARPPCARSGPDAGPTAGSTSRRSPPPGAATARRAGARGRRRRPQPVTELGAVPDGVLPELTLRSSIASFLFGP